MIKGRKSQKEYDQLFEDLVKYSKFKSTDDINTKVDLAEMLDDVEDNARNKGRVFKNSNLLFEEMRQVWLRAKASGRIVGVKDRTGRQFKNIKQAREANMVIRRNNVEIYRSFIVKQGKRFERWRDANGRFTKAPTYR